MERDRWLSVYEHLLLPYVLAFSICTVGVAIGFVYPAIFGGEAYNALALVLRWLGVIVSLFAGGAVVWWLVVDPRRTRLFVGAALLGILTGFEALGGGYLAIRSPLATSVFALIAATLTALSLLLAAASLATVTVWRVRYGRRLLIWHWALVLAVPVALVMADRALPFEPDPVIGLVFIVVPFVAVLLVADAVLVRMWFERAEHRAQRRHQRPAVSR